MKSLYKKFLFSAPVSKIPRAYSVLHYGAFLCLLTVSWRMFWLDILLSSRIVDWVSCLSVHADHTNNTPLSTELHNEHILNSKIIGTLESRRLNKDDNKTDATNFYSFRFPFLPALSFVILSSLSFNYFSRYVGFAFVYQAAVWRKHPLGFTWYLVRFQKIRYWIGLSWVHVQVCLPLVLPFWPTFSEMLEIEWALFRESYIMQIRFIFCKLAEVEILMTADQKWRNDQI